MILFTWRASMHPFLVLKKQSIKEYDYLVRKNFAKIAPCHHICRMNSNRCSPVGSSQYIVIEH